jgi:hypothetical protein
MLGAAAGSASRRSLKRDTPKATAAASARAAPAAMIQRDRRGLGGATSTLRCSTCATRAARWRRRLSARSTTKAATSGGGAGGTAAASSSAICWALEIRRSGVRWSPRARSSSSAGGTSGRAELAEGMSFCTRTRGASESSPKGRRRVTDSQITSAAA